MDLSRIIDPPVNEPPQKPMAGAPRVPAPRPRSPTPAPDLPDDIDEYERPDTVFEDIDPVAASLSVIAAIEARAEGRVVYMSESVTDVFGYDQTESLLLPASHYTHPEDSIKLYQAYQELIDDDKAACLIYIRVPYKDPRRGYALASCTLSRVEEHIIGALSLVSSSVKAMHNASTATKVFSGAPTAAHLEFMRWNSPSKHALALSPSLPSEQNSRESSLEPPSPPKDQDQESDELLAKMQKLTLVPKPSSDQSSRRVAIVLERFSLQCPVLFATNDYIFPRNLIRGRSFFDFVMPQDEARIRKALESVKTWGVNEIQQPSDGGFAFNRFHICLNGRDSSARPEPAPLRNRKPTHSESAATLPYQIPTASSSSRVDGKSSSRSSRSLKGTERGVNAPSRRESMLVDAIFSPQSDGILLILRPVKHSKKHAAPAMASSSSY